MHPYRIPIALQQEVDRQINELLHLKLIEPSECEWAHPIVCVSKKNGSIRLCVDYRHLNSFTIADAYPVQNAKDLLFEVGQTNYITFLDLTKGYWQIPMAEESKPYTAFATHHGHFQFCVLPFGMKNAGSTFQKVMDFVLVKHRAYCRSYIDDVAVFPNLGNST
ncbi:retrovirus-related Pol polyprotein from transposon opus [Trichonephila clavipes]|nr:retrovirus-related Pol polyprotein from transposon opus [Trichonephila clavipes]